MRAPLLQFALLTLTVVACGSNGAGSADDTESSAASELTLASVLHASELTQPLDKASIRAVQPWLDDATFDAKWASMTSAPIEFFGGANSAYHADLATLPSSRLPGAQTLCHGDPKFDNFGWTQVDAHGVFSDNDFDDAGFCPVAADALRNLVATDLWFADPLLDEAVLRAYVDTVVHPANAVVVDATSEPNWDDVHSKGLAKSTKNDTLILGGEVQAATPAEIAAVRALAAADPRITGQVLDVTRNVRTSGGSAGLRRFWLLTEDNAGMRTILELKELTWPGTEFGRHWTTLDGASRFDVLKPFWWGSADPGDHFTVYLLGGRFVARDRFTRTNPKPDKMTPAQITNMLQAEASVLALRHRAAWGHVSASKLTTWLRASAAMLTARWRAAYAAAGGK